MDEEGRKEERSEGGMQENISEDKRVGLMSSSVGVVVMVTAFGIFGGERNEKKWTETPSRKTERQRKRYWRNRKKSEKIEEIKNKKMHAWKRKRGIMVYWVRGGVQGSISFFKGVSFFLFAFFLS